MTETTRLEAMEALYEDVKSGTLSGSAQDFERVKRLFGERWFDFGSAYGGSLDAAKALHEAVLPGWEWLLASDGKEALELPGPIVIVMPDCSADHDNDTFTGSSEYPARAWLIAILKALIAKERDQ